MKTAAIIVTVCVASTSAFAPTSFGRLATQLSAEKKATEDKPKPLFNTLFGLDLFNPQTNKYGARASKNVSMYLWSTCSS